MKQRVSTLLVCLLLALGFSIINPNNAGAYSIAGGDLDFSGGVNSSVVYSKIHRKNNVTRNYSVKATVQAKTWYGSTRSNTSGWLLNDAEATISKGSYGNTAWYDYDPV